MMTKGKLAFLITGGALLVLLVGGGVFFFLRGKSGPIDENGISAMADDDGMQYIAAADGRRQNILKLAASYNAAGEYERALNLLDGLFIENSDDEEAHALQRHILGQSRNSETAALLEAQNRFFEDQRQAAAAFSRERGAANTVAGASADRAAAAAEAAAERRAVQEAEAARKKAQEEELARSSREVQEKMRKVNDLVSAGKNRLASGDLAGADRSFSEARNSMPQGENRFEAQRLAD
ncbi:MAG: hypothetical protein LBG91_03900, partial [Treponema sp.]|nr:hypothetical protein [Treponema sp.]